MLSHKEFSEYACQQGHWYKLYMQAFVFVQNMSNYLQRPPDFYITIEQTAIKGPFVEMDFKSSEPINSEYRLAHYIYMFDNHMKRYKNYHPIIGEEPNWTKIIDLLYKIESYLPPFKITTFKDIK